MVIGPSGAHPGIPAWIASGGMIYDYSRKVTSDLELDALSAEECAISRGGTAFLIYRLAEGQA